MAVLLLETVSFLDGDNRAGPPSRIAEEPGALVRRLFTLLAERLLGRRAAAPDAEFARALASRSEHWSSWLVRMTPEEVTIELMATSRHRETGQSPPRVDLPAVCDTAKGEWRLDEP